jgi:hypothetical protein
MKRNIGLWCVLFSLILSGTIVSAPKSYSADQDVAVALSELNLFYGTGQGFALEDIPKRIQGLVMLIRLTGNEAEAEAETSGHPFPDIAPWAEPYVAFAYRNQWIAGLEDGRFGSDDDMTEQQYITLLLRALGYSEEAGDFTWETSEELAANLGLSADIGQDAALDRGRMVLISWDALQQVKKDTKETLAEALAKKKVFQLEQYTKLKTEITRPEIIPGYLNQQDIEQIATTYQKSIDDVKTLFSELLHRAKEVTPQKDIQTWVFRQIQEIKTNATELSTGTYCEMVQELWKDFWNEVDGKIKTE